MKLEDVAKLIKEYKRLTASANIYRYTNTVPMVSEYPDVFGLNFGEILPAPLEKQAELFLAQEKRAELIRKLMIGDPVEPGAMAESFGFSEEELAAYQREHDPVKETIPKNLCVLCFDDALKSQYDIALPLLKKYGFGATFFIAEKQAGPMGPGFEDKQVYMTWEQIKEIEASGFEIGNHSLHHVFGSQKMGRDFNLEQIRGMEAEFETHGIRRPVSYAYPSGISNAQVASFARECGYLWGRGNQENGLQGIRGMTYYDPLQDSPLAICSFGDPDFYTEEVFRKRVRETPEGMIFGLTYHGVGKGEWAGPIPFERHMQLLSELEMEVIPVRGLSRYIDPEKAFQYTNC